MSFSDELEVTHLIIDVNTAIHYWKNDLKKIWDSNPQCLCYWCNAHPNELSKLHESGCVGVGPLLVQWI